MLQKLGLQTEISVNFVRSVQDLRMCDALIIPGGGMPSPRIDLTCIQISFSQNRQRLLSWPSSPVSSTHYESS